MTLSDTARQRQQQRQAVLNELDANRKRRQKAEGVLEDAREELAEILVRGRSLALKIAPMARAAEISRETAHKLLRRESDEHA